ncbi:uncharacterized protein LOC134670855 [Cydia fagiglandana]|uniref:uncharacterized protein LOC134670855 n=1 Tax=Cydia fagiglandana TaxID=1458189 RepID=UPI002FEE1D44
MLLPLGLIGIILCSFLTLRVSGKRMMGIGRWSVSDVQPCANDAEMPWMMRVRRHELNRTYDAYDADVHTLADFDDSVGIRISTCMMMDGVCENFQTLNHGCARILIYFAARDNVWRALEAFGIDPPDFPIPQGEYHAENFVLDLSHLNDYSLYGNFSSEVSLFKEEQDVACLKVAIRFEPLEDASPPE